MPKFTYECMKCGTLFDVMQDRADPKGVHCPDGSCGGIGRLYPDRTSGILFVQGGGDSLSDADSREEFVRFAAAQAMNDRNLGPGELERGIIHASRRVGFDAAYLLVQGVMVRSDEEAERLADAGDDADLELILIQATREPEFNMTRLRMMKRTAQSYLSSSRHPDLQANPDAGVLINTFRWFHGLMLSLADNSPRLTVRYIYVSRGDVSTVGEDLQSQAQRIIEMTQGFILNSSEVMFDFLSERDLIA